MDQSVTYLYCAAFRQKPATPKPPGTKAWLSPRDKAHNVAAAISSSPVLREGRGGTS
jgi:hypothetical protein